MRWTRSRSIPQDLQSGMCLFRQSDNTNRWRTAEIEAQNHLDMFVLAVRTKKSYRELDSAEVRLVAGCGWALIRCFRISSQKARRFLPAAVAARLMLPPCSRKRSWI